MRIITALYELSAHPVLKFEESSLKKLNNELGYLP